MSLADMSPSELRLRMLRAASMSRSRTTWWTVLTLLAVDVAVITAATLAAAAGRNHLPIFHVADDVSATVQLVGVYIAAVWLLLIFLFGGYSPFQTGVGSLEFQRILLASMTTAGLVGISCYLTKFDLSRGLFLLLFVLGSPGLVVGRAMHRRAVHRIRQQGHLRTRILLAGSGRHIDDIARTLQRESWLGHNVVGALTAPDSPITETRGGVPVVGHTDAVEEAVGREAVDAVIFTEGSFPSADDFRRLAWALEEHNVQVIVVPTLTDVSRERIQMRPVAGLPLVYVGRPQSQAAGRWMKRLFDIAGSMALLLLLSPVLLGVAVFIRVHDGGRVLFRQTRIGRDGRTFSCLKFRSMVADADQLLAGLADLNDGDGPLFKMTRDPRVTGPGRFIRRFSLDELPQLWNVLRGEMSLVGPRPPLPQEVESYAPDAMRRLRVRPGMTGLWQVSGRSDLSWDETVRLDLYYVDNWSIVQDLSILGRTLSAVLNGRGAY